MEKNKFFLSINACDIPLSCIKYVEPFVRGIISDKGRMQLSRDSKKKTFTILSNAETDEFFTELFNGFLKDLEQRGEIFETFFSKLSELYKTTNFDFLKKENYPLQQFVFHLFDLFLLREPRDYCDLTTNLFYLIILVISTGGRMFYNDGDISVFGSRYCTLTVETY